jgi:hypothetical protein
MSATSSNAGASLSIRVTRNEIDSLVLGRTVLEMSNFDISCNLAGIESAYRREHDPAYVICKVPAEDLESVHALEENGFRFLELQLRLTKAILRKRNTSAYPYRYLEVTSEAEIEPVLAMLPGAFEFDRCSRDPLFKMASLANTSAERYRRYVLNSLASPDECVCRLVADATGETVAFGTHRHVGKSEVLLLLSGVRRDLRGLGLGRINDQFCLNHLKRLGVRRCITHVSSANYPIVDMKLRALGYRVLAGFVVMRKVYGRPTAF